MQKNSEFINIKNHLGFWDECISIYENSFPKLERENSKTIYKKIRDGSYKMIAFIDNNAVKGFYIIDLIQEFALVTFLAVKVDCRGLGIGSELCKHAISFFNDSKRLKWLFIEAEFRQSLLYEKLGFKKLKFDYFVPLFGNKKSIKMNFLAIQKNKNLTQKELKNIISKIFLDGYSLSKKDKRLKAQLQKIPKIVKFTKVK